MAFNPYGGGYWERMADLKLRGSQQQAEGIRQKWQNIGSIVPQTIGAVQDYAQQEQQMAYYKSNQRRLEMEMRRQEKAEDVTRGVDLAISRGYNPETGSHDFKSSIGDVLNQSSDTFMGPSEYGRHTGAIVRELDEMQAKQRSRMKQDYVAEQQFKANFIDQSSQLVRDFLEAHPPTDEPARQAQYGKDWEKFLQESINPMLGSSDDPVKASVIAEMRPEIPRFGGEFSAWNRDVVEGLLAAGETVNERISQEDHNIKMSNRASHYLRGHTNEAGILALQWTRDNASGLLQNIVTDQESLEKQLGLVKGEMSDQNQDIVMDALKHAGLTVYDDEFPDRVELFANKALPEQVDTSGYSQLQLAIYAGSGLERDEQEIDSLADTQARRRLDRAYQRETGDPSVTPYMDEKAELFEVHNAVKGEKKNTSAIDETLGKLHESFGEIDKEENLARAAINRYGQQSGGTIKSDTKNDLRAINLLLQSRDGGVMTEKELFEAASTPEGRRRLLTIVEDAVADEKEQLAVYLAEQQNFAGEDIAKEKMAKWLSAPGNLIVRGETGRDMFPFIPDNVTLPPDMDEDKWRTIVERDPAMVTKWALDWYADLDPLAPTDFEDPRVREVFEEVSGFPLTREVTNKMRNTPGLGYGRNGWYTEASVDDSRDDTVKFWDEIKAINEENKKLRDGIFQDFSMDMKEASPADPLSQDRQWGRPYIRWNMDILEPLAERAWWDDGSFFRNYAVQ